MEITGGHIIGGHSVTSEETFSATNAATGDTIAPAVCEADSRIIDAAMEAAINAFTVYRRLSREDRAGFLQAIASELESAADSIVDIAAQETGLPEVRLRGELARTTGQLRLFADLISDPAYLAIRKDDALPDREPLPRPDLRSMNRPMGVVVVFGASNFPLAFSTAGGDTASALAAGCPVIVKGHPEHALTAGLIARCIAKAIDTRRLPAGVFSLVQGKRHETGSALVSHPSVSAVGFTGSLAAGRVLFDIACCRPTPIPFYGEMGSVNPVFLLPGALAANAEHIADGFATSLTLGAGQFCTKPGVSIALESQHTDRFLTAARTALENKPEQTMLAETICEAYYRGLENLKHVAGLECIVAETRSTGRVSRSALYKIRADDFLANEFIDQEIFGPVGILVVCTNEEELFNVARSFEGQLTATIHMHRSDVEQAKMLIPLLEDCCGRILFNGFPTGVEVAHSMIHGGPYPASTDSRTTSVGTRAIERFLRPICYQNAPQELLPMELRA